MAETTIEWAHYTFNPVWGCQKVSPGCTHCYAETFADKRMGLGVFGPAERTSRRTFGDAYWANPERWNRLAAREGEQRRVFCASMADVFEAHPATVAQLPRLWALIRATPHLDWLLLTKRPERITASLPDDWGTGYRNVWLGTSIESHEYVSRVEVLLQVPAAVRFLSCEPLLGPIALRGSYHDFLEGWGCDNDGYGHPVQVQTERIDWVIAGGESGVDARPCDPAWLRQLRDDCAATGTPFFLKQLGGHPDKRGGLQATLDGRRYLEVPPSPMQSTHAHLARANAGGV